MFHNPESINVAFSSASDLTISWGLTSSMQAHLPGDNGTAFSIALNAEDGLYLDFSCCSDNLNLQYNGEDDQLIFSLVPGEAGEWSQDKNSFTEDQFHIGFARQTESEGIVIVGTIDLGGEIS